MNILSIQLIVILFFSNVSFSQVADSTSLVEEEVYKDFKLIQKIKKNTVINDSLVYTRVFELTKSDTILISSHYTSKVDSSFVLNGPVLLFYNNRVGRRMSFLNGSQEGVDVILSKNSGFVELEVQYRNNEINGRVVSYYPNSQIKQIRNCYKTLTLNYGESITFYESGQIKSKGSYGVFDLRTELVNQNVQVSDVIANDLKNFITVKIGDWIYYDAKGRVIKEESLSIPELIYGVEHIE